MARHLPAVLASILAAALAIGAAACARPVDFRPEADRRFHYEQTRTVSLNLLGMSFMSNEVVKYRQVIRKVGADGIDMEFTPTEYTITTSSGGGVHEIYGTNLLRQPSENPDVTFLRKAAGKALRVRIRPDATVESMQADAELVGGRVSAADFAKVQEVNESLKRIFLTPHLMMTHAVLPAGAVRKGEAYRPVGTFGDLQDDGKKKYMVMDGYDSAGRAKLRVDPKVIDELFKEASGSVPLPPQFADKIGFAGDGDGEFLYDPKRHCVTEGRVNLTARAEAKEGGRGGPAAFSVRVTIAVKEVPGPTGI